MAPPPLLLLPLLAAAIALPPLPGAAAAGGVVKATQCMWGGALCDLSSGYVVTHLSDLVPDASALNATAAAMLRAAARDAACAARPTMQACKTGAEADGCEWFDAETLPSCVANGAMDQEIARAVVCPGSLAESQIACLPASTPARCDKTPGCRWDAEQGLCFSAKVVTATDTAKEAADFERRYKARDPTVFGTCPQVKALFAAQDACPAGAANATACPAPDCAFDGSSCRTTNTFLLKLGAVPAGSPAYAAAAECARAVTRGACAAVGAPLSIDADALAALRAGNVTAAVEMAAASAAARGARLNVSAPATLTVASGAAAGGAASATAAAVVLGAAAAAFALL